MKKLHINIVISYPGLCNADLRLQNNTWTSGQDDSIRKTFTPTTVE